ncbi:MAG: HAD family hydrolase, partial [Gammaproteobacteria bacterium]
MKPAILFDLGNTLAAYYRARDFMPILEESVGSVLAELEARELTTVSLDAAIESAAAENRESSEFRVTPLGQRLERIFRVSLADDASLESALCARFLEPIFRVARLYEETLSVLETLRREGYPTGIVSNTPWGSPPEPWREEIARLGLGARVDAAVFCGDVGWRKPDRRIFQRAAEAVGREPAQCVFVGDDLEWDIAGSESAGMRPVLIDREGRHPDFYGERLQS